MRCTTCMASLVSILDIKEKKTDNRALFWYTKVFGKLKLDIVNLHVTIFIHNGKNISSSS